MGVCSANLKNPRQMKEDRIHSTAGRPPKYKWVGRPAGRKIEEEGETMARPFGSFKEWAVHMHTERGRENNFPQL